MSTDSTDPREELAELTRGFAAHLQRAEERGAYGVRATASPRFLPDSSPVTEPPRGRPDADAAEEADAMPFGEPVSVASEGADAATRLAVIREPLENCTRCRLHADRRHVVFGVGSPQAAVMFIGEAPGRDEDLQGEPFVGRAGQLLTRMIEAMGLTREEVYIANIIKCRPPNNRDPAPDEVATCEPFLRQQIEAIRPRLIVALGNFAAKTLLRTDLGVTRLRGRFHAYQGIPLMPTFHPAYLLRSPDAKRSAWADLQLVMAEMDRLDLPRRR